MWSKADSSQVPVRKQQLWEMMGPTSTKLTLTPTEGDVRRSADVQRLRNKDDVIIN